MEIRPLQIGDIYTISQLIWKTRAKVPVTSNRVEDWLLLVESLFSDAEGDLKEWLADLVGKEVAEFEVMPATLILDIVAELASQEDSEIFLFWIRFASKPDGHVKLIKICDLLRRKYGLAPGEILFSQYARALRDCVRSRRQDVEDTLAEVEKIITLAREGDKA